MINMADGTRPTPDEAHQVIRAESLDHLKRIVATIDECPNPKRALREAVTSILATVTASRIQQYRKRYELEDRIATLEAAAKPRVRRQAPSRPTS